MHFIIIKFNAMHNYSYLFGHQKHFSTFINDTYMQYHAQFGTVLQLEQCLFCIFYSIHRMNGLKHPVIYYVIRALGYFCLLFLVIIRQLTNHLAANCYVFNTNSIDFVNKITVKDIADDVQQYSTQCSLFFQSVYLVLHQNNQSNVDGSFLSKTMLLACHRVVHRKVAQNSL